MALKVKLANKAELDALAEPLRTLYKEAAGGAYVLDADIEDVTPLKTALESERGAKKDLERQLREAVDKFKDIDPEKARQALKALQDLEDQKDYEGLPDNVRKRIDDILAKRTERLRADHETQIGAFKKQVEDITKDRDGLNGKLGELLIDNAIRAACIEAGVTETAVDDVVLAGRQMYRIKDGAPVPMNGDQIIYGKDPAKPMPVSEWLSGKTKDKPHWFKGSNGGGAKNDNGAGGGGNAHVISEADARDPGKYRAAREAAQKAGKPLQIQQSPAA